jgi:large subunit ribosomal protein L6
MSRIANNPITLPSGVDVKVGDKKVNVKGGKGNLEHALPNCVKLVQTDNVITFEYDADDKEANMQAGTLRAVINNMVIGVSAGFERKLQLIGVGYRAKAQGKVLNLTLGFSHPVDYAIPEGITIETPSQTEIVVKGISKQQVGQVASEIRAYRPPEPYKGKGVRYADEQVVRKEAKKK